MQRLVNRLALMLAFGGGCATSAPRPQESAVAQDEPSSGVESSPSWNEPQPHCFFNDALAAGVRLGQAGLASEPGEVVRLGSSGKGGGMDRQEVNRVIQSHLNEVRYCYSQGLAQDSTLKGRINLRFTVGAAGRVLSSQIVSSSVASEDVQNCVGRAVCRWVFEQPQGAAKVTITYPFELNQIRH